MQTIVGKSWAEVDLGVHKGPRMASRRSLCSPQLKEFCHDCLVRSEHQLEGFQSIPYWQWPERLRVIARSVDLQAYKREYSKQQHHWKKLVHEMRQL